jgi:stringent starvation protein B
MEETSTKPYLIRAIYEWCNDNGFTPYLAVVVDERTQVPQEFVKNGEIVLNVSAMATTRLSLGNDLVSFQARFGGAARELSIPIDNVSAIYARENGHGMAFDVSRPAPASPAELDEQSPDARPLAPVLSLAPAASESPAEPSTDPDAEPPAAGGGGRPKPRAGKARLTRVK